MNFSVSDHEVGGHILLLTDEPISDTSNGKRYGIICKIVICSIDHYGESIYSRPEKFASYDEVIKTLFKLDYSKSIRKINLNF